MSGCDACGEYDEIKRGQCGTCTPCQLHRAECDLREERQRTNRAQAEVARRGDVMLAALREIERGEYNAAAMLLANVVRPPLPSPAQIAQYLPGPAPERRPAEVMHTTIGGRGVVGRLGR
jgi:DNA-binding XRE family transcriptional regulator